MAQFVRFIQKNEYISIASYDSSGLNHLNKIKITPGLLTGTGPVYLCDNNVKYQLQTR